MRLDVKPLRIAPSPVTQGFGAPEGHLPAVLAANLVATGELVTVARALDKAGVEFIVLKGVPLAHRLFGRLDARKIRDNDILVRPRDVGRAVRALHECGYESPHPPPTELRRTNQHWMMRRLPAWGVVAVELHWRAFYPPLFDVPEEIEWAHTKPFRQNDLTVTVFDEPLTLVHLAAHATQHAFSEPWVLRDVAAAWNKWHASIDAATLHTVTRATGTAHVLAYALRAGAELDLLTESAPPTEHWRVALFARLLPTRRLFEPRPVPDHRRRLLLFILTGLSRIPRYVVHGIFPTVEQMSVSYGRPASPWLYLRYLGRPFRALRRGLRRPDQPPE